MGASNRVRIIEGVRVWSGEPGAQWTPDEVSIWLEGGRIAGFGAGNGSRSGDRTSRFIYENAFALPGLIDSHVHMGIDPHIRVAAQQDVPADQRRRDMRARALAMVRCGITTARDLGGGDGAEIDLRDAIARGETPGPRLLCAGQPVTTPGGHCHFWGGEAADLDAGRAVIDRQVERGADWIKLMATGGVATQGTSPGGVQFEASEIGELVAHAAGHGRRVAAHCHGTQGIANAATGGVHTIEHCSFAGDSGFGGDYSQPVVDAIAASGCWVSPTVNSGWGRRIEKDGAPTEFFRRMSRVYRELIRAGVPLVASTDAGIPGVLHHRFAEGLVAFARYAGLDGEGVLRSATRDAALALGIEEETGTLVPGRRADILILGENPLENPSALLRPIGVFARGEHFVPMPENER